MKQILSQKIGLVMMVEPLIIEHPSTIFTDDNIEVTTFETTDELNFHVARISIDKLPVLPTSGRINVTLYSWNGKIVKCIKEHDRTIYSPDLTPALFNIIEPVTSTEYPVWKQPLGAHDAYAKGSKVTYNGSTWESTIDANVWEPGVYGWVKI